MRLIQALTLLVLVQAPICAQHGHLNAGARGTSQGDQLYWVNGEIFAPDSGFVRDLLYTETGPYAGTFNGNIILTALPVTVANGGPTTGSPALGSFLRAEIVSVTGPAGGAFSFWDSSVSSTEPVFDVPTGTTGGGFFYDLSDASLGAGSPGADPYGHIHGRRFSANQEGIYQVGFRVLDVSNNGTGGGPIHTPSDVLLINFNATLVPEPGAMTLSLLAACFFAGKWLSRRNRS